MDNKRADDKVIRRTAKDWLKVLVLLLDEAAVLLAVILVLYFLGIRIPLLIMAVIVLVSGAFVFAVHKAVIPSFHRKVVTGREGMIGREGRVAEPLTPVGAVRVKEERWRAISVDGDIKVNENVEVVGIEGLTLKVQRRGQG